MQHLKTTGSFPDGEGTLLEAPSRTKDKGKAKEPLTLRDLPADVLPPTSELPRNYDREQAIPSSIAGFQPDMDPHLRQALEALEDDAFVEDALDEDFFAELVADGEREEEEEVGFEFDEDALFAKAMVKADGMSAEDEDGAEDGEAWEARFAAFKREQKASAAADDAASDLDGLTEGGDTIGALPQLSVIGGKRRRKGTSDGSGYSMSSSSMFRNAGLSTLDDRFDKVRSFRVGRPVHSHSKSTVGERLCRGRRRGRRRRGGRSGLRRRSARTHHVARGLRCHDGRLPR
jgi:protein LTV1